MVTRMSLSTNQPRGETGTTDGTEKAGLGVCDALFCCPLLLLWWAGLGNRTNSVVENRHLPQHRLQFPFESDDACARLPQHSDVASPSAPVCSVRPDKYGMASYAVR